MFAFLLAAGLVLEPFVGAKGVVVDSMGAAIEKARVAYHRDRSGMIVDVTEDHGISEGVLITDKRGRYEAKVHPGIYDVCVTADSFTPQCKKVEVHAEKPLFPRFSLKVDPIITKHIGDTFNVPLLPEKKK